MSDRGVSTDRGAEPLVLRAEDLPEPGSGYGSRMWRRLDATLVYDSRLQPRVTGVRSPLSNLPRVIFTARDIEIDIQIRPSAQAGLFRIVGHVLDEEFEPCAGAVIIERARDGIRAELDTCGRFVLDGLSPGRHRLEVQLPLALITVPPIHI